ncbi:MAG: aminopeptidase P family protein, partial [Erysipelotrichia bacterium]|nr:aminopeptidase P family protein [Erysipelotrichia bacterium]
MQEKISDVRKEMCKVNANQYVLTSLDDIAWLLNIRGNDVSNNPVVLSYVIISDKQVIFYVDKHKINEEVQQYLDENHVVVKDYDAIYEDVKMFKQEDCVLLDKERCNYAIVKAIDEQVKVIHRSNPTTLMKAIKNDTELANLRKAHIKDGVGVTKFMYWLKNNVGKMTMDEISVDQYLHQCRASQEHFLDESFSTIAAYNANAAMMHYSASEDSKATLDAKGMLLVDSGGQYLEGTTDITRTFGLGPVDALWKRDFTLTLKGMIQLSKARFLDGCTGINLDILARQPLWDIHIDYKCGTGHGVGYLLNVHEGPHGIRWRQAFNRKEDTILQAGMVVTNEPGVYIEGSHGIRCENEMIVCKDVENEYGQFMKFETLTFVPFDLDLIDVQYLDEASKKWLNAYHQEVYEKISPYLETAEKEWLKQYTRAI